MYNVQQAIDESNKMRSSGCICDPLSCSSAIPPKCPVHCSCMKNGRAIPNSKKIDGQCKICGNWPLYNESDL
jgi:hypothetical protein